MRSPAERAALTGWERVLRLAVAVVGVLSLYFLASYVVGALRDDAEFPFFANSFAKDVLFLAFCLLAVLDIRRFLWAVYLLILGHAALVVALSTAWMLQPSLHIDHSFIGLLFLPRPDPDSLLLTWMAADAGVVLLLSWLAFKAQRARYDMRYLWPAPFRALTALAEVLVVRNDPEVTAAEVAQRADHYLATFSAHQKWRIRLGLWALAVYPPLTLHPPLHLMSVPKRQAYVESRFIGDVSDRLVPEWLRTLRQGFLRAGQQFCYMGYYGDERGARKVDYVRFSQLRARQGLKPLPKGPRSPLRTLGPRDVVDETERAEVVVIGSGAAGATVALELAEQGRDVLVLERGRHVDPADFTEDEPTQLSSLFADGALTLSRDFRFQALQGQCVGGSTVVNNAVCMDLPERVRRRWLDPRQDDTGLDEAELLAAFDRVKERLHIRTVNHGTPLNPGATRILGGLGWEGQGTPPPAGFETVQANVDGCVGCGYCNIGCAYGHKLSMLDATLPDAQRRGGVRVLAECKAEKILTRGWEARGVRCLLSDGRRITVRADAVVVSAGTIASSLLLRASGLGDGRAGTGVSFNISSPLTIDFEDVLHSERGLTITHTFAPHEDESVVLETWYQPLITQSLFMPGWFDDHWRNMRRYKNMTCLGVVVGSEANGRVRRSKLRGDLDYRPTPGDIRKLVRGLELAGRIGFRAGARRVMPPTFRFLEVDDEARLGRFEEEIRDNSDLSIGTSHPQGGNAISRDANKGIVAPDFRLYGTKNVFVCDASVFPSSITASPQLTVMALATYAARHMAA